MEEPARGIKKWIEEYNSEIKVFEDLKKITEDRIKEYDKMREAKEKHDNVPDDEGWITVGKKPRIEAEPNVTSLKKKWNKELPNFYRFQIRESKKDNIEKLRKKFEEDKQKIMLLKSLRKFKPY